MLMLWVRERARFLVVEIRKLSKSGPKASAFDYGLRGSSTAARANSTPMSGIPSGCS
jgi:hypothetical protein